MHRFPSHCLGFPSTKEGLLGASQVRKTSAGWRRPELLVLSARPLKDETEQNLNPREVVPRCIIYIFSEYVLPGLILSRQLLTRASFTRHKACPHALVCLPNKHNDLCTEHRAKCCGCFCTREKYRSLRSR